MLFIGIIVMVLGTYANLYAIEKVALQPGEINVIPLDSDVKLADTVVEIPTTCKL